MEPHVFIVLMGTLCVCQLMPVGGQGNSGSNDGLLHDDTTTRREATGAQELRRAHGENRGSSVPDTDGAPSLGRVSARRRPPTSDETSSGVSARRRPPTSDETPPEVSCSMRKKCSVGNNTDALNFYARNCFCDDLCHTYSDCCKDAMSPARRPHKLARKTFVCHRVREVDPAVEMYMVTSCPRQFKDVWVREQCGRESPKELFYRVPVSGVRSTIVYRNYYCALCNSETNVTFWQVTLSCGAGPEDATVDASAIMRQMLETNTADCGIEFTNPTMRARKCKSHISRCDRRWTGKKVKQKCKTAATAYVYIGLTVYRNKYCATCNYVNASHLTCIDPRTPQCQFDCSVPLASPPTYSILLDLSGGSASISDNRVGVAGHRIHVETVIEVLQCPENSVFDPFAAKCRPIYCGAGRVFVDGVCKPADEYVTLTKSSPPLTTMTTTIRTISKLPTNTTIAIKLAATEQDDNLNEINAFGVVTSRGDSVTRAMEPVVPSVGGPRLVFNCPLLRLNASEYVMLNNRSVLITALGEVYMPHQYLFDDGALFICSPYLDQTYQVSHNVTRTVVMFKFGRLQQLVSIIGLLISLTALAIHFFVYMMLPPLRSVPGKCLLSLVASLFTAQLLFLAGSARTEMPDVCMSLAVAMHYAFLAAFFWMNVMAVDICRTFSSSRVMLPADDRSSRFIFYSLYAWLTPAAIVGGSLALDLLDVDATADFRPHYGDGLCWITRRWALLVTFALPLALLLAVNTVLFGVIVKNLCLISRDAKRARCNERGQFVLYVKLSTIMGLTWVFGFVASLADMPVFWYVFVVFNTLQGAFICFAFVCTKKVFRLLHERGRTHRATIGSGHNGRYYSSSSSGKTGLTRPTYLSEGEALVISQETSI